MVLSTASEAMVGMLIPFWTNWFNCTPMVLGYPQSRTPSAPFMARTSCVRSVAAGLYGVVAYGLSRAPDSGAGGVVPPSGQKAYWFPTGQFGFGLGPLIG